MAIPTFNAGETLFASELNTALSDTAAQAVSGSVTAVQANANTFTEPQTFAGTINQSVSAGASNQSPFAQYGDFLSDFIVEGLSIAVPSPASLTATLSTGTAVVLGQRTVVDSIPNATNTYAASSDTYVSLSQSGVVAYAAVANGATAPVPASDAVNILKVVTGPIVSPTPTLSAGTSGSLAAGTYQVALVAYDATGYGAVSASESVTVEASGSIGISWTNPLNETSMSIYITAEGGTTLGLVESGVTGTSYTYTGAVAPGAAAPSGATSNAVQYADNRIPSQTEILSGFPEIVFYGDATLTRDQSGKLIDYAGSENGTLTLPRAQSEPDGSMVFVISNTVSVLLTISVQEGDLIDLIGDVLLAGQQVMLTNAGNVWRTISQPGYGKSVMYPQTADPFVISSDLGTEHASELTIYPPDNGDGILCNDLVQIRDITINGFMGTGVEMTGVDSALSQITSQAKYENADGVGDNLLLSGNVQGCIITDSEFLGGENGMKVVPNSTNLPVTLLSNGPAFNRFSNVYFDSSMNGALIDWTNDSIFDGCWFSNRPGNGATVGNNYCSGIQFIGCTFENSGSHGLAIEQGAENTSVIGCLIKGNNEENNGSYGIYIADNTKGFIISNNTITTMMGYPGVQAAGIYIGSGCDDYIIEGNYLLGNTVPIIDNSEYTASNRIVRNNIGYGSAGALAGLVTGISSEVLPNSVYGKAVQVVSGATYTLPTDNGNAGELIYFYNSENVGYSITTNEGQYIYAPIIGMNSTTGPTSLSCPNGESVVLVSRGRTSNGEFDIIGGSILNATQQSILAGTTSGSIASSMTVSGPSKKLMAYANAYENDTTTAQTITFPTAFTNTPVITTNTSGLTLTVSTTELTITAPDNTTAYSGLIIVEGF